MSRALEEGTVLILAKDGVETQFTIESVAGQGNTCIAYNVIYSEGESVQHRGVLKECCPAFLAREGEFSRSGAMLTVSDRVRARFERELERFRHTYEVINDYLMKNTAAVNFHPAQLGLFEGGNTLYTLCASDYGRNYAGMQDESLASLLRLMLSVTRAVELYHEAGILHLDIKEQNIFVLDSVTDLVKLFDYDSLTAIDDLRSGKVELIPSPGIYRVPELESGNIRSIGVHTDIFEIGALLFKRLFSRAPQPEDMEHDAEYNLDSLPITAGLSPQAMWQLEDILRHTLQVSRRARYRSASLLREQLEQMLSLVGEGRAHLANLPPWQPSARAVGRDAELEEIAQRLEQDGYVFIRGTGGLGKSETAKLFARSYAKNYHTIQFCQYGQSLGDLIAAMQINGINESDYSDYERLVREKNRILHTSDSHTLIVVDNFNTTHDDMLREFLPASNDSFKVIFTTRCTPAADYYADKVMHLAPLPREQCTALFLARSGLSDSLETSAQIYELLERIEYNTLVLILLAQAIRRTGITLAQLIDKLEQQELDTITAPVFHEYDYTADEVAAYNRVYSHLRTIFSVSGLTHEERVTLRNMTLVCSAGVSAEEFITSCECEYINRDMIASLCAQGWLDLRDDDTVTMHAIVSDLIADDSSPKEESYYALADAIMDYCMPDGSEHFSILMHQLRWALHLMRRFKSEMPELRLLNHTIIGSVYRHAYRPAQCREHLARAYEVSEEVEERADRIKWQATILGVQGDCESDFGSTSDAVDTYLRSIDRASTPGCENYEAHFHALGSIGECYADNSQYDRAREAYISALEFARSHSLEEEIPDIAASLAEVCAELDLDDEVEYYRSMTRESEAPEEIIQLISSMQDNMAHGDAEQACEETARLLEIVRDMLGEESPYYRELEGQMWTATMLTSDRDGTRRRIAQHLEFVEENYGAQSVEMAEQLSLVAMNFSEIGSELDYCIACAKRAINMCEELGCTDEYAYCRAKMALAKIYVTCSQRDLAQEIIDGLDLASYSGSYFENDVVTSVGTALAELNHFEAVEEICRRVLGKGSSNVHLRHCAYVLLAQIDLTRGNYDAVRENIEKARELISSMGDNSFTAIRYCCCARLLSRAECAQGNISGAYKILNEAMERYVSGDDRSFGNGSLYNDRGLYLSELDRYDEARADFHRCEEILQENNIPTDAFVLIYNNIASTYLEAGLYEQTREWYGKILYLQPQVLDANSRVDAVICANLGWVMAKLGQSEDGIKMLEHAIDGFERIGAADSQECRTAYRLCAIVHAQNGQHERCLALAKNTFLAAARFDTYGTHRIHTALNISMVLIKGGQLEYAQQLADFAAQTFEQEFSENSDVMLELLLGCGEVFRHSGGSENMEYVRRAERILVECDLTESVHYARVINLYGCWHTDILGDHAAARSCFVRGARLLERIGQQGCIYYPAICGNIKNMDILLS